jgi:hypothetical protein
MPFFQQEVKVIEVLHLDLEDAELTLLEDFKEDI